MSGASNLQLPPLREDLRLLPAAPSFDGSPRWVIFDPARHRYFQIGLEAFELLSRWSVGTVTGLSARAKSELGRVVAPADIEALTAFLASNSLIQEPLRGGWKALFEQASSTKRSWLAWLIHNYLFIRIPLVRPQRFLDATSWIVAPMFSKIFLYGVVIIALLALYLVSRQWDVFVTTLVSFLTIEGLLLYGALLVCVKSIHELGHAYTAHRYGCRVPTMGVAFMVLYPVLYTDVTDAWRLTSRRHRIAIDIAGVVTELIIATFATVGWILLPEGDAKSVCFVLATTGWVLTLAVNLNPFMRFDGYYFLADLLGVENIGPRSFALGRWWLRRVLFGLQDAPPHNFKPGLRRGLIAFAFGTWIYRLFLFLGIALLVYAFFFKVLGIILFVVEILWFIVLPVFNEMKEWWSMKGIILRNRRTWITGAIFAAFVVMLFVPWKSNINAPAVLQASYKALVYPPEAAQIETIHIKTGQYVAVGEPLFTMKSPDLRQEFVQAQQRIALLETRLARRTADATDLAETVVLKGQLRQEREAEAGFRRRLAELVVRAQIAGRVEYIDEKLFPNLWVGRDNLLARLVDDSASEIISVLDEEVVERVSVGVSAVFIADDPQIAKVPAALASIAPAAQDTLETPYFSDLYGGPVAVEEDDQGRSVTVRSVFSAKLRPDISVIVEREQRGIVRLQGEAESLARSIWRRVAAVFIREATF